MVHFSPTLFQTFIRPYNQAQLDDATARANILRELPPELLDQVTKIARVVTGASIGSLNIVEEEAVKVICHTGQMEEAYAHEQSFCGYAVLAPSIVTVVEDTSQDMRFAKHAIVTGEAHIRFYAGAHVLSPGGVPVATVCAYDTVPRTLSAEQKDALAFIAVAISQRIDLALKNKALLLEKEKFQAFMDNSPLVAFMKDATGRYTYTNQPFLENFQLAESEILGRRDVDLWPEVGEQFAAHDRWIMSQSKAVEVIEEGPAGTDGKPTWWQSYKFVVPGNPPSLGGIALNVSDWHAAQEKIRNLAGVDLLTGLPNEQTLQRELPRIFERAKRSQQSFALLHLDIDRFKLFTETYGDYAGDAMVRRFADIICRSIRISDRCYHLRCDEFIVVIEQLLAHDEATRRCNEILSNARTALVLAHQLADVSVSIGCVTFDARDPDHDAMLKRADIARKQAKQHRAGYVEG